MKWNILHPPIFTSDIEYDELLLSMCDFSSCPLLSYAMTHINHTDTKNKDDNRGKPRTAAQVWGLHLLDVTSGQVALGTSEVRNAAVIGAWLLHHIPQDQAVNLDSDGWAATASLGLNDIKGFRVSLCRHFWEHTYTGT